MSRRPAPSAAAERAAQNQQTIKTLLKLEGNKTCADCKKNKHPRWASWNLGVFVCIRCSGIHRGMGTHISRVKSVDLDAWTDEQLQSILKWGNARANKYWEAKLAEGHIPSEAKIENFIRTKYESKRWVMDGPMPDPASLDVEGDDDVPLNLVQQKAKLGVGSSQRVASTPTQPLAPPPKTAPQVDLFGDVPEPPIRPSTTDTSSARPPPPKGVSPPKQKSAADSLLGLDFFGGSAAPPGRPSSSTSSAVGPSGPSRPDLKQSILSLYASAPKPQQPPVQNDHPSPLGGVQSPPAQAAGGFGGLDDAFGNLNFNPSASTSTSRPQQSARSDPFASVNNASLQRSAPALPQVSSSSSNGGGFFDPGPKLNSLPSLASKSAQKPQASLAPALSSDFGDFDFASDAAPPAVKTAVPSASNDLFNFSEPASVAAPPVMSPPSKAPPAPSSEISSVFNLSKPATSSQSATTSQTASNSAVATKAPASNLSDFNDSAAWGSNDAWGTTESAPPPAPKVKSSVPSKQPSIPMSTDFSAWGGSEPTVGDRRSVGVGGGFGSSSQPAPSVAPDEDFGGWSSAAPEPSVASTPAPAHSQAQTKPTSGGFATGGDDLFSNVWG